MGDMTLVPIPLRGDGTACRIHFPIDITQEEAEKVARVILAYASKNTIPAIQEGNE